MRRLTGDGGFTLPELLVFIVLTGIVGTIIAGAVGTGFKQQRITEQRNQTVAQARDALQRIDRDIRSTDKYVTYATSTGLTVTESEPAETITRTYTVNSSGGAFSQIDVTEYDKVGASTSGPITSTLISHLVNTSTAPVFKYAAIPTYAAPTGINSDCSVAGSTPTSYASRCIGSVTVSLQVQPTGLALPVKLSDNGTEVVNAAL